MRRLLALLLALMMTVSIALASEPANPADPHMVAALLPGYSLVEGIDDGDELRLLMRNPAGELVFVGGVLRNEGWLFTESTPLPAGTILGVENFTHSLGVPSETYYNAVSLHPYADGTWGVSQIYPRGDGLFSLWRYVITDGGQPFHYNDSRLGVHPWADITTIDWTSLPGSFEEAVTRVDQDGWARVNNPNREDRLHLRVRPYQDAYSLGKYYNGTPVQIREFDEEWCAVTVCGLEGWMMTDYLAFGSAMDAVEYHAAPWLDWKENLPEYRLYSDHSSTSSYILLPEHNTIYILGVAGDDWLHVWLPYTEQFGYVRRSDLWEGNG